MADESAVGASEEMKEIGHQTAKRGIIYVAGEAGTSVVTAVMLIVLARLLQPAAFGNYTIAIAFLGMLTIGSTFGVGVAFRKMLPETKKKTDLDGILSNGYTLALGVGLAVTIIGLIASGWIAVHVYDNPALGYALELAAAAEFLSVLFNLGQAAAVGMHMVKEATYSNIAYSVGSFAFAVGLVVLGYGYTGAVLGTLIGLLVGSVVSIVYIAGRIKFSLSAPSGKTLSRLTTFSGPVVASQVATFGAQNFGVLFLGVFAAQAVVGNYGAAFKIARVIELGITTITFILLPAFSTALMKKVTAKGIGEMYNKSLKYTSLLLFPAVAYMIAVASPFIRLLFSTSYASAPLYFAIIAAGMAIGLIGTYAGTLMVGYGDIKKFMWYQLAAVALQVALLVVLTPTYRAVGVLVSLFVITPVVLNVLYIKALEREFRIKHQLREVYAAGAAAVALGLVLYGISYALSFGYAAIAADLVVAVLAYPPAAGLAGAVSRSDITAMRKTASMLKPIRWLVEPMLGYTYIFAQK